MATIWKEPVTDRTAEDVEAVKTLLAKNWDEYTDEEKETFLSGLKGALNTSDLERVQNNIKILLEVIESTNSVDSIGEFMTAALQNNIKANLTAIRGYPLKYKTTPEVPETPYNTYQKWNDIEQILHDAYSVVQSFVVYYCGNDYYCGDSIGLID